MKSGIVALIIMMIISHASLAVSAEAIKIGIVDVQKVLMTSDAGKSAQNVLSARIKQLQEGLQSKSEEIKKLQTELNKKIEYMNDSARSAKDREYQQKLKEFQRAEKDAQDEARAKEEELIGKIGEDINLIVKEYGGKNGFSVIWAKTEFLMYVNDSVEVTSEIIKALNSRKDKK